jgi:hypothetical protein
MTDPRSQEVHDEQRIDWQLPARPRVVWTPHPDVLQEHRWVREFVATWNPLPTIRHSYAEMGWVWWLMYAAAAGCIFGWAHF